MNQLYLLFDDSFSLWPPVSFLELRFSLRKSNGGFSGLMPPVTNPQGHYPLVPHLAVSALLAIYIVMTLHFQLLAVFLQN